jgi:hypothetical protein
VREEGQRGRRLAHEELPEPPQRIAPSIVRDREP